MLTELGRSPGLLLACYEDRAEAGCETFHGAHNFIRNRVFEVDGQDRREGQMPTDRAVLVSRRRVGGQVVAARVVMLVVNVRAAIDVRMKMPSARNHRLCDQHGDQK